MRRSSLWNIFMILQNLFTYQDSKNTSLSRSNTSTVSSCSGPGQIKIIRYKNPIPSLSWETTQELGNFPLITRQSISNFPRMITQQTHVLSGISIHRLSSTSNSRTLRKWSAAMNQLTTCLYVWIFNIFFTIVLHDYLFFFSLIYLKLFIVFQKKTRQTTNL